MLEFLAEAVLNAATRKSRFFRWFNTGFFLLLAVLVLAYWRELV